jgi:hypothetical protein
VGTFVEDIVTTDKLGRRTGPRTQHTIEEKLRIVQETRVRGASVATVARRHNISPSHPLTIDKTMIFRRKIMLLYRVGAEQPTVMPNCGADDRPSGRQSAARHSGSIRLDVAARRADVPCE